MTGSKWCRTYGARVIIHFDTQPFRAGLTFGGPALRALGTAEFARDGGKGVPQRLKRVCENSERKRRLNSALLCGTRCPQGLKPIVLFQGMYGLKPVPFREERRTSGARALIRASPVARLKQPRPSPGAGSWPVSRVSDVPPGPTAGRGGLNHVFRYYRALTS